MKSRGQMVIEVATAAHEDWQRQYRVANGDRPRMKKTTDPDFTSRGINEVNIAALSYMDLPRDWQAESSAGAECAVDCVIAALQKNYPLDEVFVEKASTIQHDNWLERNGSWAPDHQKLPYAQLAEGEKDKDRFFVRAAIRASQS